MNQKNFWICMALSGLILTLGCKDKNSTEGISENAPPESQRVSSVALRVMIVSRNADHEPLQRLWLSVSEQPLDIQVTTAENFLGRKACDCDIVLYPARLLGELVHRAWLKKAKEGADGTAESKGEDVDAKPLPAAWKQQTFYAGVQWAQPLGCSIPVLLFDRQLSVDAQHAPDNWEQVMGGLDKLNQKTSPPSTDDASKFDPSKCDPEALVDRFLTIANRLSTRNANYGLLFEMQTMKPRITGPEFIEAARILQSLAAASENSVAAAGSWQDAWKQIATGSNKAFSVGLAGEPIGAQEPVTNIGVADLPQHDSQHGSSGKKNPQSIRRWNTGGGLLVSLSESCRQSSRAEILVEWLSRPSTRDALAKSIPGIDAESPVFGADSSAWQVTQLQRSIASQLDRPPELRFPATEEYRAVLAQQLTRILTGEVNARIALGQVSVEWDKVTDKAGRNDQRSQYEFSLGLSQ